MIESKSLAFLDEFRSKQYARRLLERLAARSRRPARIMEVCGTHTMAISRHGIRQALPKWLKLISGPGCPVCVTANSDIDTFIEMAQLPDVIAATFGDMLKVPGTRMGLADARSRGAHVQVVYSTLDALELARQNPSKHVVFFGVGFETTAPTVAAAILKASSSGLNNFFVYSVHKLVPPALEALCQTPALAVDAFLCPGHVSAIIGPQAYRHIVENYSIPCVISGFEPVDILHSLNMLIDQLDSGQAKVEVQYLRGVRADGNPEALKLMNTVFEPSDASWRGLGFIPRSGLAIKKKFAAHDASRHFQVDTSYSQEPKGCLCGSILTGIKLPTDCKLFGNNCLPDHPVGPCMVSSEGACAAYFHYESCNEI